MAQTLLFIVNPRAGRTRSMGPLFEAVAHFGEEGYLVSVRQTQHPGHATEIVEAEGGQFDRVVCCGGDGTLNEVANGLMRLPPRLWVTSPAVAPTTLLPAWSCPPTRSRPPGASPPAPAGPWTWACTTAGPLSM